nr:RNA-directed DNA polymerase, eukaryota, reverse transcriptase zinc-binding domain protein [Tanacetum cinerariifolium]
MASNLENVRLAVLMKLQEALDEEVILEEQMLALMHRFADRFMDRRVEINNLIVLHDHPLIDYVTLGRLLPRVRGLGFKPRREGFPSKVKKKWGLSPKAKVRVLHTAQLDVTEERNDYGPNSFKIFNSWMEMDGFDEMVKNSCMEFQPMEEDSKCVVLKNKLKFVKGKIKVWHAQKRNDQISQRKLLDSRLGEIDRMIDDGQASGDIMSERRDVVHQLLELDAIELKDNAQKSKKKWIKEGDENTKLFHGMLKRKRSQKNITGVVIDGEWVTDPQLVKEAFREYYANKFKSFSGIRSSNRSQRFWDDFQTEVVEFVHEFSDSEVITLGCNASFIALIPKCENPTLIKDFRPISLIGLQYKIIVNMLADRLVKVVNSIVSPEQSAFIKGRQITNGALMVNEIVTWAKKYKKKKMMFKVDFEKAYDSLSWDYLDCMFEYMGFGDTWRKWIHGRLVSARASVLLNGRPTKEFQLHKEDAVQYSRFKGVQLGNSSIIMSHSHHFYADAVIFMGECDRDNVECLLRILNIFYLTSGLQLNFQKSKLLPVGERMYRVNSWTPLMVKFKKRLANWKSKLMSIGGRLTLVKFVLGSLEGGFLDGGTTPPKIGVWASIMKACKELHTRGLVPNSAIKRKVGNGRNTRFWKDLWCGDGTLEATYPRLIALASNRNVFVSDYWSMHAWNISWRRDIRGGWEFDNEETFTVRSVRKSLDVKRLPGHAWATRWCNIIPIKVNVFVWRAFLSRLPTRTNLDRRWIDIDSILCPCCNNNVEDISHVFFAYSVAIELWFKIGGWLELDIPEFVNVEDMFQWIDGQVGGSMHWRILNTTCVATV